jgi:hypothetical protein
VGVEASLDTGSAPFTGRSLFTGGIGCGSSSRFELVKTLSHNLPWNIGSGL